MMASAISHTKRLNVGY